MKNIIFLTTYLLCLLLMGLIVVERGKVKQARADGRADGRMEGKMEVLAMVMKAVNPGPERTIYTDTLTNCTFINSPVTVVPNDCLRVDHCAFYGVGTAVAITASNNPPETTSDWNLGYQVVVDGVAHMQWFYYWEDQVRMGPSGDTNSPYILQRTNRSVIDCEGLTFKQLGIDQ